MKSKDKLVYLEWDDSSSNCGWFKEEGVYAGPWKIKSIGYIARENKTHIAITTSIGEGGNRCDPLTIAKTAILKRRNLKVAI